MAKRIRIQHREFKERTDGITDAGRSLATTVNDVPTKNSCYGIRLQDYVKKVQEVSELLFLYGVLLQLDVRDIVKSVNTIEQADQEAEKVWKVIT